MIICYQLIQLKTISEKNVPYAGVEPAMSGYLGNTTLKLSETPRAVDISPLIEN